MTIWEYASEAWSFRSAARDDWPGRERFETALRTRDEALESELVDEWRTWRDETELAYLNAMGDAGFELVSIQREWIDTRMLGSGLAVVHAYFKRPKMEGSQPAPKPIGFLPIDPT